MKRTEMVKALTLHIYHHYHGMTDEDWFNATGEPRRSFAELEQHEQDDYRGLAEFALEFIEQSGMVPPLIPTGASGWEIGKGASAFVHKWEKE